MSLSTPPEPSPETAPKSKRRSRRSIRRRVLLWSGSGAILLLLLILLATGPAFPFFGKWMIREVAASQGIEGDLKVTGSLWGDFTLEEVRFSGEEAELVSLEIGKARLRYSPAGILFGFGDFRWLESVLIEEASVVLSLPEPSDAEQAAPRPRLASQKAASDYSPLWNLLDATVDIRRLNLEIRQGEGLFRFAPIELSYSRGEEGSFSIGDVRLPQSKEPLSIGAKLASSDHAIGFRDFSLGEVSTIQRLEFTESAPGVFEASTELTLADGILLGRITTSGEAALQLRSGSRIDLSLLPVPQQLANPDPNANPTGDATESPSWRGEITDLDLRFTGDFATPSTWKTNGSLVGNSLGWGRHQLKTVALVIAQEKISLEALRDDARLLASFEMPFSSVEEVSQLARIPIRGAASLEIPAIEVLLDDLVGDHAWSGSIQADLKDFQVREGTRFDSGNLLVRSENLAWDGRPISTLEAAATVEPDSSLSVAANLALDAETKLRLDGSIDPEQRTYEGKADLEFAVNELLREILADLSLPFREGNGRLLWSGKGSLETASHDGSATLALQDAHYADGVPFSLDSEIAYEGKEVRLPKLALKSEPLSMDLVGAWNGDRLEITEGKLSQTGQACGNLVASIPLQIPSETPFLENPGPLSAKLTLDRLALGEVFLLFSEKAPIEGELKGELEVSGSFPGAEGKGAFQFLPILPKPVAETVGDTDPAAVADVPATRVDLDFDFRGDVTSPRSWNLASKMNLSGLEWDGRQIEDVTFRAETRELDTRHELFAKLEASAAGATLASEAVLDLTEVLSLSELDSLPVALDLDLACPDLSGPWRDFAPAKWQSVPLAGDLSLTVKNGVWGGSSLRSGALTLSCDALTLFDESFEEVRIDAEVTRPDQVDLTALIRADQWSHLEGTGDFDLVTQAYRGDLESSLDLQSEGLLRNLLANRTIASLLPAKTNLALKIAGEIPKGTLAGNYTLAAENLLLSPGASPIRTLSSSGDFSESSLKADLSLTSAPLDLEGRVDWENAILRFSDWTGTASGRQVLSLEGSLPLERKKLAASDWFASDSPIDLKASLDALSFATIYDLIGQDPPLRGRLDLDLEARGTPARPEVGIDLDLEDLAASGDNSTPAGSLSLQLATSGETARLEGAYRHPDVKPLFIEARMPFHPGAWATGQRSFAGESFSLTAKMDRSSLGFLATQVPAIESIEGTVALDIAVTGTPEAPEINGDGLIEIGRLRLQQAGAPSFYDIELATSFSKNQVSIDKLSAIVAGGIIDAGGRVRFEPKSEPQLDFRLRGSEILVFRNPDVSIRTDADLALRGPWSRAAVSGEVGLVNSRYFRNFDLLPTSIPLPSRSTLPEIESGPRGGGAAYSDLDIGVKIAPFQDWSSNVRVYTKTPFQVRSNLVESDLVADLRIGGTLGRPAPDGELRIAEGAFSLPFSSVDVETGTISFDEKTGFNGSIELKARAKADQYRINAYLYNRVLDPKYVLTSVPPMPSEDIITLLVTGTTRDDLISGDAGSLAASKAATLLFKNFRKASARADRDPNLLDELQERTELEIGGINAETGAETIGGKIRLWKQLFFVGNVDAGNDYRAVLKYVFRFR